MLARPTAALAGAAIFGFAAQSIAAVGIGAGAVVAAGLLSVFFASSNPAECAGVPPPAILFLTTSAQRGPHESHAGLRSDSSAGATLQDVTLVRDCDSVLRPRVLLCTARQVPNGPPAPALSLDPRRVRQIRAWGS